MGIPGGTQESGESLFETLQREFLEELDLNIAVGDQLGIFRHAYSHYKVTLHAYHIQLIIPEYPTQLSYRLCLGSNQFTDRLSNG